ncbi:GtrA family protein [Azospirillum formosense]|uniref:GtrA family protein n=1 Tax=Azospirillum formosense TaxID=861533 RepID=A0ABX2L501_9PROT|nr:GtrA family protein [Azospirillum formosense]MBY3757633.1 GtrA family protein [Azospirillum formosense]NUB22908.1 GtrA family protein [Azospirillum formosense]
MSLQRQASRFLVVGTTTVAIDMAAYSLLLWLGMAVTPAKTAGFVAGTIFAYFANRMWTFGAEGGIQTVARFLGVYLAALVINIAVNAGVLLLTGMHAWTMAFAFLAATGVSAVFNFVGMRHFAFSGARQ